MTIAAELPIPAAQDGSPIGWPLRAWLVVEVGFGLAAMGTIALNPGDSATNFAWPIKPDAVAALIGAFYMSSAWIFVLAAFGRRWEDIRVMMIPAILFTFTELMATFIHFDKFLIGTPAFYVWFASYLMPPSILAVCYFWQQRRAVGPRPDASVFPRILRWTMAVIGALLSIDALVTFEWPYLLISTSPIVLTPLTTRVLCGWLLALGGSLLFTAIENDRERTLVLAPFFILLPPSIALQLSRFAGDVDWSHPRIFINAVMLSAVFLIGLYLAGGNWRRYFGSPK